MEPAVPDAGGRTSTVRTQSASTGQSMGRTRRLLLAVAGIAGRLEEVGLILGPVIMLVTVGIQIAGRLSYHSLPWTEEVIRYTFLWTTFLGMAAGFRRAEHARVTFLISALRLRIRSYSVHLYFALSLTFFAVVVWTGYFFVRQQYLSTEISSALRIPMWLVGCAVPISGLLAIAGLVESVYLRAETRMKLTGKTGETSGEP